MDALQVYMQQLIMLLEAYWPGLTIVLQRIHNLERNILNKVLHVETPLIKGLAQSSWPDQGAVLTSFSAREGMSAVAI